MINSKEKTPLDPEIVIPKVKKIIKFIRNFIWAHKKLTITVLVVLFLYAGLNIVRIKRSGAQNPVPVTNTQELNKNFEFPSLNASGKPTASKIKLKVTTVEKTNQVMVKDQSFFAKNDKLFLIININLKNDATTPVNIIPGDLVRLTVGDDEENKYAPDLHNNVVFIAAISTKPDRLGFVIPDTAQKFKLYIGEIEGKKEEISIAFPS